MSQPMPRIAPLTPPYPPEIQAQFDRIMRGAPPLVLFRVMAGHGRAWDKFRAGGLLDPGPLSLRMREIVIDRTCALNKCEYEWGVHVAIFAGPAKTATWTPHSYSHLFSAQVRSMTISRSRKGSGPGSKRLLARNRSQARVCPAMTRNSISGGAPRMMRSNCCWISGA